MNEGLHVNGITLSGTWDAANLQKDLPNGFHDPKDMNNGVGSSSNSPNADNNTSSVSTMLESLRSNLSQIYSDPGDSFDASYPTIMKTESPRSSDFCSNPEQETFNQQARGEMKQEFDSSQAFDLYNPICTSSQSSMQRQFQNIPYDTNNMINNALFAQQQAYPAYPLPVKPEPTSPNSYQLNPYYLSGANGQALYPPTSMNPGLIDYQGYRLSDMMLPNNFNNNAQQEQLPLIKTEYTKNINHETDQPATPQQLLGLNGMTENENIDQLKQEHDFSQQHGQEAVGGPMRIRRIKRPIPAGPSYPVHLWQFILELLGDHSCKDFISWTGNDLEFKVINSRELARRWGRRKNNARMNFDKLSRAMRYYYEKNIIKHIPGQRLVYRFCRNPDDIVFTQLLKTAMGTLPPETRLIAPVTTNPHFASTINRNQNVSIPEQYMFSTNCLSQVQQHVQQLQPGTVPAKHIMGQ